MSYLTMEFLFSNPHQHDRLVKLDLYHRDGVQGYWIIDTDSRTTQVFLLNSGSALPN